MRRFSVSILVAMTLIQIQGNSQITMFSPFEISIALCVPVLLCTPVCDTPYLFFCLTKAIFRSKENLSSREWNLLSVYRSNIVFTSLLSLMIGLSTQAYLNQPGSLYSSLLIIIYCHLIWGTLPRQEIQVIE